MIKKIKYVMNYIVPRIYILPSVIMIYWCGKEFIYAKSNRI